MKKTLLFLLLIFAGTQIINAQRELTAVDETDVEESFDSADQAGVIIRCKRDLTLLSFESNMDKEVQLLQTQYDDENDEVYYCLTFTPGNRTMSISVEGYNVYDLPLHLDQSRMYRYRIYDANVSATATFFDIHRKNGQAYFDQCDYLSAREEFTRAYQWSQATDDNRMEAMRLIENCDSLLYHRKMGYAAADLLHFEDAIEHLNKAMKLNPRDMTITNKLSECNIESEQRCSIYKAEGDRFLKLKEYADAVEMYQKVIDRNCDMTSEALTLRVQAQRMLEKQNGFDRYFGLEFSKTYGFTYATYRKRNGGYFTMRSNSAFFDMLTSEYNIEKTPELNISFGTTIPVYTKHHGVFRGVWLHAGIGAATVIRYDFSDKLTQENGYMQHEIWTSNGFPSDTKNITQDNIEKFINTWNISNTKDRIKKKDLLDSEFGFAATPEIGVAVKVWHFMARLTYQYRYSFNKDYDNIFGKSRMNFGIGYCW